jgi:hypothetical protein
MLDSYIIVGLVMVFVGVLKTCSPFTLPRGKLLIPLLVFAIAGMLNVCNALVFGGQLLHALRDGFVLGAAAGGIYSMGKAAMNTKVESLPSDPYVKAKSVETKFVEQHTNNI